MLSSFVDEEMFIILILSERWSKSITNTSRISFGGKVTERCLTHIVLQLRINYHP